MIFFKDIDAFSAKVPRHSVGGPWGCSQARGAQSTFQESIPTSLCQNDNAPTAHGQQESLGEVILVEVLTFAQSGGFDEQLMRQSRDEGAFEAGRELGGYKLPAVLVALTAHMELIPCSECAMCNLNVSTLAIVGAFLLRISQLSAILVPSCSWA